MKNNEKIGAIHAVGLAYKYMQNKEKGKVLVRADSTKPIIIPIHNWSSQIVMAYVIGGIFESKEKNVKYVNVDSQAVYEEIRKGDVTISHEVWESSFGKSFNAAKAKGGILDWGDHEARTLQDMGYPNHIMENEPIKTDCEGLPDWNVLKNPKCAQHFIRPDSDGKGQMLEGPQSWHGDLMPQRLKALGLDDLWTVKFSGGVDALWAELAAAKKEDKGTIIWNWTPHFTDADGFTFIDFPQYTAGCRPEDGGDGKCGSPDGYLKKAVNADFPKTHPAAAKAFRKLSFTTSQIGEMAALVDIDKMTPKKAAKKWLDDNKSVWKRFFTNKL